MMDARALEIGLDDMCECGSPLKTDADVCEFCFHNGESKASHQYYGCFTHEGLYTREPLKEDEHGYENVRN